MTATDYHPNSAGASATAKAAEIARAERPHILLATLLGAAAGAILGTLIISGWAAAPAALLGGLLAGAWQRRRGNAALWRLGAAGERRTGRMLNRLERRGWTVLHDRALPHTRANLDHLLIAPDGTVYNVDSKVRRGAVRWDRHRNYLRIGKSSGYQLISSTQWETERITDHLARAVGPVTVASVLAVHRARLPRWHRIELKGVHVMRAHDVRRWLTRRTGPPSPRAVEVAAAAATVFPPYGERTNAS